MHHQVDQSCSSFPRQTTRSGPVPALIGNEQGTVHFCITDWYSAVGYLPRRVLVLEVSTWRVDFLAMRFNLGLACGGLTGS